MIFPLILLGASLLGTTIGGVLKGVAQSKQRNTLNQQRADLETWYHSSRNIDLLDSSSLQASLNQLRKTKEKEVENRGNDLIRSGATTEAKIAGASKTNKEFADVLSKIAAKDSQNKADIRSNYLKLSNDLSNKINAVYNKQVENYSNTFNNSISTLNRFIRSGR